MKTLKLKNYKVTIEVTTKTRSSRMILSTSKEEAENSVELINNKLNWNYTSDSVGDIVSEDVTVFAEDVE